MAWPSAQAAAGGALAEGLAHPPQEALEVGLQGGRAWPAADGVLLGGGAGQPGGALRPALGGGEGREVRQQEGDPSLVARRVPVGQTWPKSSLARAWSPSASARTPVALR